jgi:hypothetical protein
MNSSALIPPLAAPGIESRTASRTVLLAGAVAATIDLVFAFVFFGWQLGITPLRVLQSVATGWYGRASFEGGIASAAVGLVSHYLILMVAASLYLAASRGIAFVNRHAIACGLGFGVAIYLAMTFVIVPLSAAPMRSPALNVVSIGQFLIHPVLGLAIALIVRRAAQR